MITQDIEPRKDSGSFAPSAPFFDLLGPYHASGDLPVAFANNEVSISFVPFATRFEIRVALHANALTVKIRNSHIKVRLAGFVS